MILPVFIFLLQSILLGPLLCSQSLYPCLSVSKLLYIPIIMASATGIPEQRVSTSAEDEPLLGRPGDASQQEGQGIQYNFVLGEAYWLSP
jgi:hypothetical protein